ncbi:glycosyltransferase family 2 protein [Pseudomonas petrae]|uniref:Glycosyltransferase family 2 protein n=1 Tax=Pseudomonas petrae TaxID=2912190 RepID=A0ABS9IC08_9PSED|nr:glycosyltransferase family 2 protein [Pseudomonas petrae]MCF7545257.1 glycosyltransferase family 2 protein [Pseudomonas petrae]
MSLEVLTTLALSDPTQLDTPIQGAIVGLYGDVLQGWALDSTRPEQTLVVEILVDGASVALARADQFYPNANAGDDFHGFTVQLRQRWLDEARHISARVANIDLSLAGDINLPAKPNKAPLPVATQVWHSGGLRLGGWAWDPDAPQRHVQVIARENDRVLAQISCEEHHQALVYRATSNHGFTLDLPWELADGKPHVLHIENDLGQPLSGSPIHLCCWPEGLEGLLRNHEQQSPDKKTLALLSEVAKDHGMRLPKSAGFHHYPQWFEAFQRDVPAADGSTGVKIGLLLIADGEADLGGSIGTSRNVRGLQPLHILETHSADVLSALKELLETGCEAIVPIKAGDHLASFGLDHLSSLLSEGVAWGYGDCDRDGPQGERSLPWLKPVWDVDLFIGADIFTPGAIFSATIVNEALTLLAASDLLHSLSWDHLIAGVALATEKLKARVVHLPHVVYHRHHQSPPSPEQASPLSARQHAIAWLCDALTPGSTVSAIPQFPALLRAHWPLPSNLPRVSLIVPTRDQVGLLRTCIEGLLTNTDYPDLEIIVVDNQSSDPQALAYLSELPKRGVQVLPHPFPFNYSTINNRAVEHATGDIIGLVNNDIEIIESGWLKEMVSQLLRDKVGAVGAKLLWPNRMVQHGGVVVGINGLAAHTGNNLEENDAGYLATNQLTRRQSAVTAACLLVRRSVFDEVGGLDEVAFPVAFNDVDFCLRIQATGRNVVWTAFAKLIHAESASRGKDVSAEKQARAQREQQGFIERWAVDGSTDPYYHTALSHDYLSGAYGGLAMPPHLKGPRT